MAIFKCKMCGGTLEVNDESVAVCEYCGTKQTLPKLNDDRRANLYDRANHFRRNNDFDKAMGIYEQILNEDNADSEAYWSLVLCRYGIEYVEDPASHKRIPTVNRAQFTSIFDDEDYKSALQYADTLQREVYEAEASAINEIQKGILAISQKEEPFDIFICYKETDNNGRRTQDSVLATELYHELTREGFKVFFSRITLEDKLGVAYEPYIFAALNSAKVMVVLGTRPEHFNAVWVKNEWSRYLALIKNGAKKTLIPAYRDMDPYDLPEEFSHLQAQDMSKLGFMQDLVRGITKIAEADAPKVTVKESGKEPVVMASNASGNTAALMKRGLLALEDGEWAKADEFFEQVLNMDAENAQAYLGKMLAELHVERLELLVSCREPFDDRNSYQKVLRFADADLTAKLKGYNEVIRERGHEIIYRRGMDAIKSAHDGKDYLAAVELFREISGYKDADAQAEKAIEKVYNAGVSAMDRVKYELSYEILLTEQQQARDLFKAISGYKDANERVVACEKTIAQIEEEQEAARLKSQRRRKVRITVIILVILAIAIPFIVSITYNAAQYNQAVDAMKNGEYQKAFDIFISLDDYKDSYEYRLVAKDLAELEQLVEGESVSLSNVFGTLELLDDESLKKELIEDNDILRKAESLNGKWKYISEWDNKNDWDSSLYEGYRWYVFENGKITWLDENQSKILDWDLYAAKQNGVTGLYIFMPRFEEGDVNYDLITDYTGAKDDQMIVHEMIVDDDWIIDHSTTYERQN